MLRSLIHYWKMNLAVLLAAAVAAAVITGALLVGDSVRGSLRDLTLDRLGRIDYAVTAQQFFRDGLADDLKRSAPFQRLSADAVPAILLRGSAIHSETRALASQVNIIGVDGRFGALFDVELDLERKPGQIFQSIILNEALRRELAAKPGDQILLNLQRASEIHRESLMGNRDPGDQIQTVRLEATQVVPNKGAGRFSLFPSQAQPLNAFVRMEVLQRALGRENAVNALLVSGSGDTVVPEEERQALQEALNQELTLTDHGLKLIASDGLAALQAQQFLLRPWIVEKAFDSARALSLPLQLTSTYLANRLETGLASVPYSTITAVDPAAGFGADQLLLADGTPAPPLNEDEILLNQWAASDLDAQTGDDVLLTYYWVGPRDELQEKTARFKLRGIAAMEGLTTDPALVPDFPGISEADDMSSWSPPFPVQLNRIRPKDEAYWDEYKASPKSFVSLAAGQNLWASRFGSVTSIRLAQPVAEASSSFSWELFERDLLKRLPAEASGFDLQPVKQKGLDAASGPTDFSGLFIAFSFFLVVSATLIVGMLFRLSVENRAREIGLLLSLGFPRRAIFRRFLAEALALAASGAALGIPGAALYAGFLMYALRTWWVEAVGTTFLTLHVLPATLLLGWSIALVVVLLFTTLAARKLFGVPKPLLLAGETAAGAVLKDGRRQRMAALVSLGLALALLAFSFRQAASGGWGGTGASAAFFGVGAFLLAAGLFYFAAWCRAAGRKKLSLNSPLAFLSLTARNSARNPGRSVLSAALVASACFVIVAVGANRLQPQRGVLPKDSGTGGFALVAQSEIPILKNLSSPEVRLEMGFKQEESDLLDAARIFPIRVLPGDDASCLNLYRPEKPRILGVPKDFADRGGFTVSHAGPTDGNPWRLLEGEIEPRVIPAFGDHESVQWILQLGLGQDVLIEDEAGNPLRLRLVGLIENSLFQSELLISEENFLSYFPSQSGYSYFLIEIAERRAAVSSALEDALSQFGFDVTLADEKLASYQAVRSTYISTFQTLGGLGLLLGTLGLAIVLIRNVIERRGELATLRAFGFRRRLLAWMVLAENAFLLFLGLAIGAGAALVAVAPTLAGGSSQAPWISLAVTLLAVAGVGMLSSAAAVRLALRIPMLPALRGD